MRIEQSEVLIATPDGQMPGIPVTLTQPDRRPAVLLLIETFGLTSHIRDVAGNERSNYNQSAAEDAWRELTRKFSLATGS